jgi:hypothetical protein
MHLNVVNTNLTIVIRIASSLDHPSYRSNQTNDRSAPGVMGKQVDSLN